MKIGLVPSEVKEIEQIDLSDNDYLNHARNISGDKIPVQMLQKLYRHSNITTTIRYQSNFINKTADDALDAVLQME